MTPVPATPSSPSFGLGPEPRPILGEPPGGLRGGGETPAFGVPAPIIYTPAVVENYVQPSIRCADGTFDVANGVNPPCATKGGVYMPSLPAPAPAPTLPTGQSTVVSSPLPTTAVPGLPANVVAPSTNYAALYDTAALGTQIAQTSAPAAPTKDDTQKYLMYGGIALVGVLVLNSLLNRD
jgi:hypothetical protein